MFLFESWTTIVKTLVTSVSEGMSNPSVTIAYWNHGGSAHGGALQKFTSIVQPRLHPLPDVMVVAEVGSFELIDAIEELGYEAVRDSANRGKEVTMFVSKKRKGCAIIDGSIASGDRYVCAVLELPSGVPLAVFGVHLHYKTSSKHDAYPKLADWIERTAEGTPLCATGDFNGHTLSALSKFSKRDCSAKHDKTDVVYWSGCEVSITSVVSDLPLEDNPHPLITAEVTAPLSSLGNSPKVKKTVAVPPPNVPVAVRSTDSITPTKLKAKVVDDSVAPVTVVKDSKEAKASATKKKGTKDAEGAPLATEDKDFPTLGKKK